MRDPNGIRPLIFGKREQGDETEVGTSCKLTIYVEADSLQQLRQIVDDLLAIFSDQDQ